MKNKTMWVTVNSPIREQMHSVHKYLYLFRIKEEDPVCIDLGDYSCGQIEEIINENKYTLYSNTATLRNIFEICKDLAFAAMASCIYRKEYHSVTV